MRACVRARARACSNESWSATSRLVTGFMPNTDGATLAEEIDALVKFFAIEPNEARASGPRIGATQPRSLANAERDENSHMYSSSNANKTKVRVTCGP